MNEAIEAALVAKVQDLGFSPEIDVVKNIEDSYTPTIGREYIEVRWFPAPTNTPFVGKGRKQRTGILQVTAVVPRAEGLSFGLAITDQIIAHFEKGTIIDGNGVRIKIPVEPSQASPAGDGAWLRLPVSINYQTMV